MRTRSISTKWRWVGALAAVFVPSAVVALTIPNEFSPGDPIVSADVNENFSAIAAAVTILEDAVAQLDSDVGDVVANLDDLSGTVDDLSGTVDDLANDVGALGLNCTTVVSDSVTVAPDGVGEEVATCADGTTVTGGGCLVSFPNFILCQNPPCGPFVATSGFVSAGTAQSYTCRIRNTDAGNRVLRARARCCSVN